MFNVERKLRGKRIRALILAPTRELAIQVEANIVKYSKHLNLSSIVMVGGVDSEPQKERLIDGVDILVATPGRLIDMLHQRALYFDELEVLVLDEADKMLDMGFIYDIEKIIDRLPSQRQCLLFSATTPKINQWLITVDKDMKSALLSHLIKEQQWNMALIFIDKNTPPQNWLANLKNAALSLRQFMAVEAKPFAKEYWLILNQANSNF